GGTAARRASGVAGRVARVAGTPGEWPDGQLRQSGLADHDRASSPEPGDQRVVAFGRLRRGGRRAVPGGQPGDVDVVLDRDRYPGQRQPGQVRAGGERVGGPARAGGVDHLEGADPGVEGGDPGEAGVDGVSWSDQAGPDGGGAGDGGGGGARLRGGEG